MEGSSKLLIKALLPSKGSRRAIVNSLWPGLKLETADAVSESKVLLLFFVLTEVALAAFPVVWEFALLLKKNIQTKKRMLLPFNGCRRFRTDVEYHTIDSFNIINDLIGN